MLDVKRLDEKFRASEEALTAAVKSLPLWLERLVIAAAITLAAVELVSQLIRR